MAQRQTLPQSEREFLATLEGDLLIARVKQLHGAGWSLASIATAFDPPKQRSSIRAWTTSRRGAHTTTLPPIPPASPSFSSSSPSDSTIPTPESFTSAASPSSPYHPHLPLRLRRRVYDPAAPKVTSAQKRKIANLAPLARRYRARMHPNGMHAQANRELTELCKTLHRSGASVRELSLAAGVTYRAMARRLGR